MKQTVSSVNYSTKSTTTTCKTILTEASDFGRGKMIDRGDTLEVCGDSMSQPTTGTWVELYGESAEYHIIITLVELI